MDGSIGVALCGHEDMIGYLAGTPCAKCVKVAHAKATGRK